jgi:hypothetical protein
LAGHGLERLVGAGLPWLAQRYRTIRLPSPVVVAALLIVLAVLDLLRVDSTLLDVRPIPPLPAATAWLQQQPGLFRVYSPSYSLPYGDGLQHVDGVDPLQLSSALGLIGPATGASAAGYSVTVPPFATADVASANAGAPLDAAGLAQLDVKYVAAEFDVHSPKLQRVQTFGRTRVYENGAWQGRAWVDGQAKGAATITEWSPNRIAVAASGPGRLVLSEINYPGWQAWVDGQLTAVATTYGALRAVVLPAGPHDVVFEFRPWTLYVGGALSLVGVVVLACLLLAQRRG